MTELHISSDLTLGVDYVTKTAAILAQRRKGKTYTASVIAEELVAAGQPFVALDPTGAWWGLRASADGKAEGLPVRIIGGQHGDLPLEAGAGRFVADLVLDHPGYYVIDFSLLDGRPAEREFATAFAVRLHRRKMQPGMDFPLHLFIDEADLFVPQERELKADTAMLAAYQGIVRRGGLHGLGTTLISQRPALVNKSVLTQLDILVLLRLVAGNDQDAIDKNYISRAGTKEQRAELMASLSSLALGEAWVWEPGAEPQLYQRVRIRERRTFNSSATPKPGEARVEPKRFADVDIAELKEQMADAIERAKDDDPKELRAKVRQLEQALYPGGVVDPNHTWRDVAGEYQEQAEQLRAQLAAAEAGPVFTADDFHAIFPSDVVERARAARERAVMLFSEGMQLLGGIEAENDTAWGAVGEAFERVAIVPNSDTVSRAPQREVSPSTTATVTPIRPVTPAPRDIRPKALSGDVTPPDGLVLKAGARRMVDVLARFDPTPLTRDQLSTLADVKKGGTFSDYLRSVVLAGLAEELADKRIAVTGSGLDVAGGVPRGMTRDEVLDIYRPKLKAGARRMLDLLVERHPDGYSRLELSELADVARGGTFSDYLRSLTRVGLADERDGQLYAGATLYLGQR